MLKDFKCGLCKGVLVAPLCMPCGHHFCKACINKRFEGQADSVVNAARTMRARKVRESSVQASATCALRLLHALVAGEGAQVPCSSSKHTLP